MVQDDIIDIIEIIPPGDETAFSEEDLDALREAKYRLEHPNLTARLSDMVGRPFESAIRRLPARWHETITIATETALLKGLEFSLKTMGQERPKRSRDLLHKALATGAGALGGAAGVVALSVELPISTCVMLRSIADIARAEGHDISAVDVKLACLEVFALGGDSTADDAAETGYWVVRGVLSKYVSDAAAHIAMRGLTDSSAPAVVRLIAQIAARFGVVVSEQAAATAVPVVGAVTGGAINYLFIDHFQNVAKGHFIIRRLEKKYDAAALQRAYEELIF